MRMIATLLVLAACAAACGDAYNDDSNGDATTDGTRTPLATRTSAPSGTPTPQTPEPTGDATEPATPAQTSTVPPASGTGTLSGYVHIGPTCPVVREGEDCDDRPHEADMDIVDNSGVLVTTVRSDANGVFTTALPAGAYTLQPSTDGRPPSAGAQKFVINAGQVTEIDVPYDSGIR